MKKTLLAFAVLIWCSSLSALPTDVEVGAVTTPAPAMDPSVENDIINRIASIQYAPIDSKIKALSKIVTQSKSLRYISPTVQYNFYAAVNKIFSDLMAATKKEFSIFIRQFMALLNDAISCSVLDVNQKTFVRSYIAQLNQQYQNLTRVAPPQRGQKSSSSQIGRLR